MFSKVGKYVFTLTAVAVAFTAAAEVFTETVHPELTLQSDGPSVPTVPAISSQPSTSQKPSISNAPSRSATPSLRPSLSSAPSTSALPSISQAPSLRPSVSSSPTQSKAPSDRPSVSKAPSTSSFPSQAPSNAVIITASDEALVASAQLIMEIDPLIREVVESVESDPTNALLAEELRNRSAVAWSSSEGMELASTLDASDSADPAYLDLRGTASEFLRMLCDLMEDHPGAQFTQTTKDCACNDATNVPTLHCAARADREFVNYMNVIEVDGPTRRGRSALGCEIDTDFFKLFQSATIGKPICLAGGCEIPFPPPMNWMGFEIGAKGCIPGLDLTELSICEQDALSSCKSIEDELQEAEEEFTDENFVNYFTDPNVLVEAGICLLGVDDLPFIGDVILKFLDWFDFSHCVAQLELSFHYLIGYLGFEVNVGLFEILKLSFNLEAQFYDEIKDHFGVCLKLNKEDCIDQGGKDKGQNSCSLRAGQNRGKFSVAVNLLFYQKEHKIAAWGANQDGSCLATCPEPDETEFPVNKWTNVGYRGTGELPSGGDISGVTNCVITAGRIQEAPYNVIPDDGIDDSDGIQAAIDFIGQQCSGDYSRLSLVELPAGTIDITKEIHLDVDFLILRGAGSNPDSGGAYTRIEFRPGTDTVYDNIPDFNLNNMTAEKGANGGWIWPGRGAFRIQTREVHEDYASSFGDASDNRKDFYEGSVNFHWKNGIEVARTACIGSTELELTQAGTDISIGDYVWVGGANSQNMYDEQGVKDDDRICMHMRQQIFKVVDVKRGGLSIEPDNPEIKDGGDTITIDKPLEFSLYTDSIADISREMPCTNSATKSKVVKLNVVRGVGLEDFFLTQVVDGHDVSEAKFNYNNIVHEQAMHGIVFKWAVDGYVRNVHTHMTGSHPIVTEVVKNMQFEGNMLDGSWNKGKGGNGYFRNSKIWDSLIRGNIATALRHLTLQWSASGNVVTQNTLDCDLNLHGGWERHNLIEQNTVNVPYNHRDSDDETWYPIWWAAGEHAGGWSGATGPRNVFFNNVLNKQTVAGGAYETYTPYSNPDIVFQFGWDRRSAAGSTWEHLSLGDQKIVTWTGMESADFWTEPGTGINANCLHSGESLVGIEYETSCAGFI